MKKYKTIMIDPPWDIQPVAYDKSGKYVVPMQYETMTLDEIRALPVGALASDGCSLFLWATQTYLPDAFELMKAWGFKYHLTVTWDKGSGLTQFGWHRRTEFALFGYKNGLTFEKSGQAVASIIREFPELFDEPATVHSRKPVSFIRAVEAKTETPRLEMFARAKRAGWEAWGNQVESDIDMNAVADFK